MIHAPRITGEVVVPLAVTLSTLAWVMQAAAQAVAAGAARGAWRRPSTPGMP